MAIRVICGGCHAQFTAPMKAAARRVRCPKCGAPIEIPVQAHDPVPNLPAENTQAGRDDPQPAVPTSVGPMSRTMKRGVRNYLYIAGGVATAIFALALLVVIITSSMRKKPDGTPEASASPSSRNPKNAPQNDNIAIVGVEEAHLFEDAQMTRVANELPPGTKVEVLEITAERVYVSFEKKNGWMRRPTLCSQEEYARRAGAKLIPTGCVCIGRKDEAFFFYGGVIPIVNNRPTLEPGCAFYMDSSTGDVPFALGSTEVKANPGVLYLYRGREEIVPLAILPGGAFSGAQPAALATSPPKPGEKASTGDVAIDDEGKRLEDARRWSPAKVARLTFRIEKKHAGLASGFRRLDREALVAKLEKNVGNSLKDYGAGMDVEELKRRYDLLFVPHADPAVIDVTIYLFREHLDSWPRPSETLSIDIRDVRNWDRPKTTASAPFLIDLRITAGTVQTSTIQGKVTGRLICLPKNEETLNFEFTDVPFELVPVN